MKWNGIAAWGLRIVGEPRRHAGTRSSRLPQPGRRPPDADQDAYPIERYAWEVVLPYHFEREAGGTSNHVVLAELTQARGRNVHVGIKAPLAITDPGGGPASGVELSGFKLYGLYNFNTEGAWLPALSLRTDLSLPWGGLGGNATRVTLKAIATRSWGLTRLHLNVAGRSATRASCWLPPSPPHDGG